ncbi:MAG: D-aminoacyl-tRNA deacylase [Bacilli bacterium]|nr:D-aminoacyl-tRNA deacylase [Bacilli bacterium]
MKVVIQKVKKASCRVDGAITGQIERGFLVFVGFTLGDNEVKLDKMIKKIVQLRIFNDENDKMNLNLTQVNGAILSISQFTLYANTENGNRPSFTEALRPEESSPLYDAFNKRLEAMGIVVAKGIFGAHMDIELINDGPVTILLEF